MWGRVGVVGLMLVMVLMFLNHVVKLMGYPGV